MRKYETFITELICLECGYVNTIQRNINKKKEIGHIKDLYCPSCKADTKYYEVGNYDEYKARLDFFGPKNSEQQKIYDLINNYEGPLKR